MTDLPAIQLFCPIAQLFLECLDGFPSFGTAQAIVAPSRFDVSIGVSRLPTFSDPPVEF